MFWTWATCLDSRLWRLHDWTLDLDWICLGRGVHSVNANIRLLKIDKPQLNTEMLKVKVIHT